MNALGYTPLKLEMNVGLDDRSVFACQTPEELTTYRGLFKAIPNCKQVNSIDLNMFSANWGAY